MPIGNSKLEQLLSNVGDMSLKRRGRMMIEALKLKEGDKVLDIGCGDGFFLHLMSNLGLKLNLIGIDYDRQGLMRAEKNLESSSVKIKQADLMKQLPFKDNTFSSAIMSEVAEHLPDDKKGLREVYRVLKPGGRLAMSVPNANYPFLWDPVNRILEDVFRTHFKSGFWAGIWNEHIRLYTPQQINKVVKSAGFKVEKVACLTHYCLPFNHYLLNLAARMLYGGKMSVETVKQVSKFKVPSKRKLHINLLFWIANTIDRLNRKSDYSSSTNVIVIASK